MDEHATTQPASAVGEAPSPSDFTASPLRNRLRLELDAPVADVWQLLGDLSRFPEYSTGPERVEATHDGNGRCIEYTCYFKPVEGVTAISRDVMKWYEPNRGYLSVEVEGDAGTEGAVALTTLDPTPRGTAVTYDTRHRTARPHSAVRVLRLRGRDAGGSPRVLRDAGVSRPKSRRLRTTR